MCEPRRSPKRTLTVKWFFFFFFFNFPAKKMPFVKVNVHESSGCRTPECKQYFSHPILTIHDADYKRENYICKPSLGPDINNLNLVSPNKDTTFLAALEINSKFNEYLKRAIGKFSKLLKYCTSIYCTFGLF